MSGPVVLVAGAGPAGATCALALAQAGVPVALLDRAPPPGPPAPDAQLELRVSALSAGVLRLLDALGVWQGVGAERQAPYVGLEVWEDGATIRFDSALIGEPALGAVVENRALVAALSARLAHTPGVTQLAPGTVRALARCAQGIEVRTSAGETLRVGLAVAAEGADSPLRALAGIAADSTDFRQAALVTHVRTAQAHRRIAYQRFLPDGPLALLPLADGRLSVVWSTTPAQARMLAALADEEFMLALASASAWRLGEVREVDARLVLPLRGLAAHAYAGARVALVGDAAHVLHPLAGLGATLALTDAAALAELVASAHAGGRDPGDAGLLRRYARWRRSANAPVVAAIETLRRLYGVRRGPLPWLRRAGLALTDRAAPLKLLLTAQASAVAGDLPALMRCARG